MKAWNPDLVINVGVGPNAYLLVKQAYDVGLFPKVPMLATFDWPTRTEYWDAVGDKGNYILYMTYYKPGMPVTRFRELDDPQVCRITQRGSYLLCV